MPFCFQQDVKYLQPGLPVQSKSCQSETPTNHWLWKTLNEAPWDAIGYVEVGQPQYPLASEPSQLEVISVKNMKGVNRRSKTMMNDKV
jgi:hypothetical protein